MMNLLLKNHWKIITNTIRTQSKKNMFSFIIGVLVIAFFLYLLSKFVWTISSAVSPDMIENMLSFWFLSVTGLIILMGLPYVFKTLYSGSDLEMLFTMPIPTRNIFWVKYIQSYLGIPLYVYIISIVPIVVYGIAVQANLLYFAIAFLALFAITIIGLSIIYLLNLLLIQVVPPGRANEFMTIMSFLSGIIVYLVVMLPNFSNDKPLTEVLISGLPILPKWVPVSWGSSAIAQAMDGSLHAFVPLGMLILLAGIMMIIATMLVEKGFRTGWIRLSEGSSKRRGRGKGKKESHTGKLSHPVIAIGKKEWLSIKRDLREWLTLMPIIFFIVFGFIGFFNSGGSFNEIKGHGDISWPVAQGILLFIYAFTNASIAAYSIGREGPNLWIMQVMPISGKQMAYGKFLISWLIPFLIVSLIEVIATFFLGWTIWQLLSGLVLKGMITMGVSAIGLWIGTLGAKYNPTNPQQRLNFGASIVLLILPIIYLFIVMIPIGYLLVPDAALNELPGDLNHGVPGFGGVLLTVLLTILSFKVSHPVITAILGITVLTLLAIGITYLFLSLSARSMERGLKIDMISESSAKSLRRPRLGKGGSLY